MPPQGHRDHHVHARDRRPAARVRAQAHRAEPRPHLRDRPQQPRRLRVPRLRAEPAQAAALGRRGANRDWPRKIR